MRPKGESRSSCKAGAALGWFVAGLRRRRAAQRTKPKLYQQCLAYAAPAATSDARERATLLAGRERRAGTSHLYVKWGACYLRWRSPDGRHRNRRVGKARTRGEADGLIEEEGAKPTRIADERSYTLDEAADAFPDRLVLEGARRSYRQNCESMQRVHVSPAFGKRRVDSITSDDIERLARRMLRRGGVTSLGLV